MGKSTGPAPQVNGISPNEGTPGTKLTIRGENLGNTASDLLHVFIAGIDVGKSALWFSPKKLTAITPMGEGELEIVVVTESGGIGTAAVKYHQNLSRSVGPQTVVTYWPEDERKVCHAIYEHHGNASSSGGPLGSAVSSVGGATGSELDSSTGLPMSEITRLGIPLSESALKNIYPQTGSVHLTDKEFDPIMFLLKFYKNSSFNDLMVTFNNFRQSIKHEGSNEPVNVIRTNLVLIFRCLEGMDTLRNEINKEKSNENTSFASLLESILCDSRNLGHQLFEDILKRRDKADSTRNAISVMQRYQFLFNLPHAIRTNIAKGDYSLVLNDYLRARSLFANLDSEVLRRVYADIENVISDFAILLRNQLIAMPIDCEEARRKIGYLAQLEVNYDPSWLCLIHFKDWLIEQLRNYQQIFIQTYAKREYSNKNNLQLPTSNTDDDNNKSYAGNVDNCTNLLSIDGEKICVDSPVWFSEVLFSGVPPMVGVIKSICRLLINHVTQFWRLGALYVSGQLNYSGQGIGRLNNFNQGLDEKLAPPRPNNPQAAWIQINLELIHVLSNYVRESVLEAIGSGSGDSTNWLSKCIWEFRDCCNSLPHHEMPSELRDTFARLAYDLRRHAVRGIFHKAQTSIEALQLKENWDVEISDNDGGITKLPYMYEEIIKDALHSCEEQVVCGTSLEKPLFESVELQERFPDWCSGAMTSFLSVSDHLADQIESTIKQHEQNKESQEFNFNWLDTDMFSARQTGQSTIIAQARGLLLLINNLKWIAIYANQRLVNLYKSLGYISCERLEKSLNESWEKCLIKLTERYVKLRSNWLSVPVKCYLNDYLNCIPDLEKKHTITKENDILSLEGAHTSIRLTISNLSHIYSELLLLFGIKHSYTKSLSNSQKKPQQQLPLCNYMDTGDLLRQIIENLIKNIRSSFIGQDTRQFPRIVQLQLTLDLHTIKTILPTQLFTKQSISELETICSILGMKFSSQPNFSNPEELKHFTKLLDKEKARMRLLMDGFATYQARPSITIVQG